jgi:hypothetical protein
MTEPALEGHSEAFQRHRAVLVAEGGIEVLSVSTMIVDSGVQRTTRRWAVTPSAAIRDVGHITIEHELFEGSERKFEVRLAKAELVSLGLNTVDEGQIDSPLWTRVTVSLDIARVDSHRQMAS